jgi:SpoVK/Ycf46/Vps4 family AAA+-type ATPase
MGTYFSSKNAVSNRFFFVVGSTADEFCDDLCRIQTIEWLLYQELKVHNYSRIIFYDKTKWRLYFYDENSLQMTLGKPRGHSKMGRGPLKGFLPQDAAILNGQANREALNRGAMSVEVALNQIDACMRDEKIRTAVIVNDAEHFIRECDSDTLGIFTQYQTFNSTNENIVIFIFPQRKLESIVKLYERNGQFAWGHLFEPYFPPVGREREGEYRNSMIFIGTPNATEIRSAVNNVRLSHGLQIKFSGMELICNQLARACAKGRIPLKTLDLELKNLAEKGEALSPDNCYAILGQKFPETAVDMLDKMIGLSKIKEFVNKLNSNNNKGKPLLDSAASRIAIRDPPVIKRENLHIVLTGNPGTGKTTAARLIGQVYYELGWLFSGHLVKTTRSDLVSDHVGGTAFKTREKIAEAMGGVLFIDEAYALTPKDSGVDFGLEAINELVEAMSDKMGEFACVFAGYPHEMRRFLKSNPGLESRVQIISLDDYNPEEMRQILEIKMKDEGCCFSSEMEDMIPAFCKYWVQKKNKDKWANGREAENLARELRRNWEVDPEKISTEAGEKIIQKKHFPEKLRGYVQVEINSGGEDAGSAPDLVGFDSLKTKLNELIEEGNYYREHPEIPRPAVNMHWILRGNPGTGKTTFAKRIGAACHEAGFLDQGHTVIVTRAELVSNHVGETALRTKEKIEDAMGGVLFIDEAYALKQYDDDHFGQEAINTIIEAMTAHNGDFAVIVAGYPVEMERFLQSNPGFKSRFSNDFVIEDYTAEELCQIFYQKCRWNFPRFEPDKDIAPMLVNFFANWLADKSPEWGNGREVEKLFTEMQSQWIRSRKIPDAKGRCFLSENEIPERLKKYLYQRRIHKNEKIILSGAEQIERLIGFEDIKQELRKLIKAGEFRRKKPDFQYTKNMHWILRGNPGTGKTTVAKLIGAVYREAGFLERGHTVVVTRADLVAGYLGQTALKTREKIKEAMGGVLFIDEAYALKQRGDDSFGGEAINTILEAMTAHNGKFAVIVAGYPREMEGFIRANSGFRSRFSNDFMLMDYTPRELKDIFLYKCRTNQTSFEVDVELEKKLVPFFEQWLSKKPPEWGNGREVEKLITEMLELYAINNSDSAAENTQYIFTENEIPERLRKYIYPISNNT